MTETTDAELVRDALVKEVRESFASDVEVVHIWIENTGSVCVLYRRAAGGHQVIGRRVRFPPHARDDDPASTGADAAQDMAEPLGALAGHARLADGIMWVGIPEADPLPTPPGRGSPPSDG
ncbi:hypothetical protein [Rathayibacter tanaceti]|uniref:Uncharacterized protein n=2 Tax=Rathayibacter tanaceti TaxID=1671680 RepID=A0A166HFQ2_9MICO|nr:hypothetical protein [Rathayibacter tanaceti]KZX20512.1 hypothetical protein ACH61_02381 [Rathayibacter tanaceti]QHC56749.1 hypothetical protein GSU10_14685 [Rathayibacter tanaceti]TCO33721.1 hypothetical protein EV639_1143 [Rathayibacter tanaceti]